MQKDDPIKFSIRDSIKTNAPEIILNNQDIKIDWEKTFSKTTLDNFTEDNQEEESGTKYRTRKQAQADKIPENLATPSTHTFQSALTILDGKNPHMIPIDQTIVLTHDEDNDTWYFNGIDQANINLAEVKDPELAKIDLWTLRTLYSIIGQKLIQEFNNQTITLDQIEKFPVKIYVPDLLRAMGVQSNPNKKNIASIINKIRNDYRNLIGILPVKKGNRIYHSMYATIVWHSYNANDNTITFASPYLNHLLFKIIQSSIKRDKEGKIKTNSQGHPLLRVNHSYLLKTTLASERNKRAAENVRIICVMIEQAGNTLPHISARTIIERNPELEQALMKKNNTANQNTLLRTTFKKTWELLRTQTHLLEKYPDISIPNTHPTMSTLDMVFEFPHS